MRDPDAAAARAFIEAAGVELRFLCEEFGFDEPTVDHGPFAVWVTFKSTKTAVKATLDTLDKLVEVFVVKLVAGALPPYDETEATHYVDSLSLASAPMPRTARICAAPSRTSRRFSCCEATRRGRPGIRSRGVVEPRRRSRDLGVREESDARAVRSRCNDA
jgi:hypothetical protein